MSSESRAWWRDRPRGGGRGRGRGRHEALRSSPPFSSPSSSRPAGPPPAPTTTTAAARTPPPSTAATPIRGQCAQMCSKQEQREREREKELSRFERVDKGGVATVLAVKKYRRAAAGTMTTLDPSEVRPPKVLLATLDHLFGVVMPWQGGSFALADSGASSDATSVQSASDFLALYEFLSDRIRSVRQDFTVQHVEDASLESALEQVVRFYALAGLRAVQVLDLGGSDGSDKMRSLVVNWSDKLHDEQLASALAQLQAIYRGQHSSEDAGALTDAVLDCQAAFVGYDLLLRLEDARGVSLTLRRLPARLRDRPCVRRALGAFVALQLDDFRVFLAHFEAMTVLEKALALRQLPRVWARALKMLNKALGKQDRVPLAELGAWLSLGDDVAIVEQLCSAMNVHVERVASTPDAADAEKKLSPVDSWEQQDGNLANAIAGGKETSPTSAFVRFKVNQPNDEMDASAARKLVRSVALRRVLRQERDGGLSVSDLVRKKS